MLSERPDDIGRARRWFAEELRHTAHVRSPAVVEAFATVPREHFAGPGPWRVLSPMRGPDYWTTDDADPRRLHTAGADPRGWKDGDMPLLELGHKAGLDQRGLTGAGLRVEQHERMREHE